MEKPAMTTTVESLPVEMRDLFEEVIGGRDRQLLEELLAAEEPNERQRAAVHEIVTREFSCNLRADHEPTDRGRQFDNMLGAFLLRWPVQGEWLRSNKGR